MNFATRTLLAATLGLALAGQAYAYALPVASYDMANGSGTASGGSYNYWDLAYNVSSNTMQDGAPLTGGTGDLTDGVIALGNWNLVENGAGTGPYVGWRNTVTPDPSLLFHFTPALRETFEFASLTLHLDDADGFGGVRAPTAVKVRVGGFAEELIPISDPIGDAPFALTIDLHNRIGDEIAVQLFHRDQWLFLSEVSFDGLVIIRDFDVREPGSLFLFGLGLIGLGLVGQRRLEGSARHC